MKIWPQNETERLPKAVNLDAIEKELRVPSVVAQYASRRQVSEIDQAVIVITSFGELPAKEMDDAIFALKEELAELEGEAQRVRNAYVEVTDRLRRHIEKQKAVHKIAKTAFAAMAAQCAALEQPELPFSPPPAIEKPVEPAPVQEAAS